MPNLISSNFRGVNALNFVNSVAAGSYYSFIGRHMPWEDDANPPTPVDSDNSTNVAQRAAMVAMKKINSTDICIAVKRHDWIQGTVYTQYSTTDKDILAKNFYVYTPTTGNVYKCISNNNGAPSTSNPTLYTYPTQAQVFQTADGYKWKYMYNISGTNIQKFLTPSFMYCPTESPDSNIDPVNSKTNMPVQGHAANIPRELGAFYVIISANYEKDESGQLSTAIDYRTFGIIKSPTSRTTGLPAVGSFYKLATRLRFSVDVTGKFALGDKVTIQEPSATVESYVYSTGTEGAQDYIEVVGHYFDIPPGSTVVLGNTTATATSVVLPDIRWGYNSVLSYEYRTPIMRAPDQVEALNIVLEF